MAITYGERRSLIKTESAGSAVEAAAGIAILVLAIIGLANNSTGLLTSIATVILGCAMFVFGATIATEFSKLFSEVGNVSGAMELGSGMSVEISTGAAAIVLGILGIIGISPQILIPSAIITVGAGLMLSSATFQRLNTLRMSVDGIPDVTLALSRAAVTGAVTSQVLAGLAAVVLGILALCIPASAASLVQVGLIVLGAAITMSSTALTGRVLKLFSHNAAPQA